MSTKESHNEGLRRHPRKGLYLQGDYQVILPIEEKNTIFFETENISIEGFMFFSYDRIETGTHLQISLYVEKSPIRFSSRVVWIKEWLNPDNSKQLYAIGLKYTQISPEVVSIINEAASKVVLLQRSIKKGC